MSEPLPAVTACVRIERAHRHIFVATDLVRTASEYAEGDEDMARLVQQIDLKLTAMHDELAMAEWALHRILVPEDLYEARERLTR